MAGDFNKPVNTDAYATLLQFIRENLAELAKGLDASTAANIPSGAIRFNSTTKRWEKWNGSAWSELVAKASASYDIRTTQADDIVVGASTAKGLGQVGPAAASGGVSNANNYITTGTWFVPIADAITNWPEAGLGGFLQVVTNSSGGYVRQTFFIHDANRMYSRYSTNSGSTWSAWKHVTANADWDAASGADGFIANKPTLGTVASKNLQTDRYAGDTGTPAMCGAFGFGLTAQVYNGNLNDISVTSIYYCSNDATNRPVAINGWVETFVYSASGYAVQKYHVYGYTDYFIRVQKVGVWDPWTSPCGGGFLVAKTTNQTIAAATITKVTFGDEVFDEQARFGSSTFTVRLAGRYLIGATVSFSGTESQSCYIYLRRNGGNIVSAYQKEYGSSGGLSVVTPRDLLDGDTIELYCQFSAGAEIMVSTATRFWGVRL